MNLKYIMENLFTNKKVDWLEKMEETEIQPFVIQRCLAMNDALRIQVRWLDKYVFVLPSKMYLSLAWSVLPKTDKVPYVRYIKKVEEEEEFDFIIDRVRKHFQLSDNDYRAISSRLLTAIKSNMVEWFSCYGIPKKHWRKYNLDFSLIKKCTIRKTPQQGLSRWGM